MYRGWGAQPNSVLCLTGQHEVLGRGLQGKSCWGVGNSRKSSFKMKIWVMAWGKSVLFFVWNCRDHGKVEERGSQGRNQQLILMSERKKAVL